MPITLRKEFERWWYVNSDQISSAALDIAYRTGDVRPLQQMFARCWEAGAAFSFRESARTIPAVQRFTEMLILLGEWDNESRSEEMGTG